MKKSLLKNPWFWVLLSVDLMIILGCIVCRWLSGKMLETETTCAWLLIGGKCFTCGGTHFVNSLLRGHLIDAFFHNEFLFLSTAYLAASLVLLHPFLLFRARWAKRCLRLQYNIPTLILFFTSMFAFMILRNLTPIKLVVELLIQRFS